MVLPILGAIAGGLIQAGAANKAANTQKKAADKSLAFQKQIYADDADFREAKDNALRQYTEATSGPFEASQGYRFRLNEANDAIEASAAARGGLFSGATMQALDRNSQNYATGEFDNYLRRLQGVRAFGPDGSGQAFANAATGIMQGGANAASAGIVGVGKAVNQGIEGGIGAWQYQQQQQQNQNLFNALRGQ